MPAYQYRCRHCGAVQDLIQPVSTSRPPHLRCRCGEDARRVFGFSIAPLMEGHYNPTVGRYVSGKRDFNAALRTASSKATDSTGIVHDFQPVDLRDKTHHNITDEGMKATHDAKVRAGTIDPTSKSVFPMSDAN